MSFRPPRGNRRGGGNDRGRGRGDRGRGGSSRGRGRSHNEEVAKYGISYQKIQELCDKMDKDRILSGSAELLAAVLRDAKPFYNRLEDLWPEITKQLNFLRVIVATASNNQADVLTLTHDFLAQVLSSKFIEKAIDENIYPMTYNQSLQTAQHAEFSHNMVKLLLLGFQIRPTLMDPHLPRVETVINRLKAVKNVYFLEEELVKDVEKLEVALKARQEAKLRQHEAKPVRQPRERPEFLGSAGAPPSNFRHLSIVPTAEDISTNYEPYLRPAKVRGQYDDDEHYLDVMFRLLREDLHRPLREGIAAYKNKDGKKADIFVYKNVYLDEPVQHKKTGELVSYAHITVTKRMRFDKRLIFGSLVCLSPDDFKSEFLFATVHDRDRLVRGAVGLMFEEVSKVNPKLSYKMVESPAFFEAYRHVMLALQTMPFGQPIPFSNYLVRVQTNTAIPGYLNGNHLDFNTLFKHYRGETEYTARGIQNDLDINDFNMDQSQFEALKYALTSSLAIIQGPPGTGKTYIGLQIAKLLLNNRTVWNPHYGRLVLAHLRRRIYDSDGEEHYLTDEEEVYHEDCAPMLVICYTNHALDQFLEGISDFCTDIIRVGGRSKNEAMEEYNLCSKRYSHKSDLQQRYYEMRDWVRSTQKDLTEKSDEMKKLRTRLVDPSILSSFVSSSEKPYFNSTKTFTEYDKTSCSTTLYKWLTQTTLNAPVDTFCLDVIYQLTDWGVPEIKAKNAVAFACQNEEDFDANYLYRQLWTPKYKKLPNNYLLPYTPNLPRIADVKNVMALGYSFLATAEMLINADVNSIREEHQRSRRLEIPQHRLRPIDEEEEQNVVAEDLEDLVLNDENEDDKMIVDNSLFHDINDKQEKNSEQNKKQNFIWFDYSTINNFANAITTSTPMTEEEANNIKDVWKLSLQKRWQLYQYWVEEVRQRFQDEIEELEERLLNRMKQLSELRSVADIQILKRAKVVGMTTTGAAKHQSTLRALRPRIVIVEEAAEVLEAHLLASLTHACQHLILIGDHKQLRPNPAVYDLAVKYNLEISLFERLINNGYPYRMLENQHRMCPDISRVLMPHFYDNLLDDPSVFEKEPVRGVTKNLMFIDHSYPEVYEEDFKSHKNPYEAAYALALGQYFVQQGYKVEQITILCAYMEQLTELRKEATNKFGRDHGYIIQCVDNYQGEENDIIILSLVRSNNPENKIGFLKTPNRVCVALSRAKLGLYVLCNMNFLASNCGLWENIRQSAVEANAIGTKFIVKCELHQTEQKIQSFEDFGILCPEGGCTIPCNTRLDCGHSCAKPCHPDDIDHEKYLCLKRCDRKCESEYKHPCKKECYEECGNCMHLVEKKLPCNHEKLDFCYLAPVDVECVEPCELLLPCGHICGEQCGEECSIVCKKMVSRQIPGCSHLVEAECSADLSSIKCNVIVEKEWPFCKHVVKTKCSSDVSTLPCPHPCEMQLPDCEHLCKGSCGKCRNGRLHISCTKECNKILFCGHECQSKCSKVCPPCSRPCETACGHNQCGKLPVPGEQAKPVRSTVNSKKNKKGDGRKCGEPCPPCAEDCLNHCEHRKCENKCGDACSVQPCNEPCTKLLSCDPHYKDTENIDRKSARHECIGVCGDDCPKICKICNPVEFAGIQEVFFGTEEDEDARFVQLKDCGHCIEVTGLDQWIQSLLPTAADNKESTAIVQINCPKCKTPIRRSKRYISLLNERAIDIENIKQKTRGLSDKEKKKEKEKFQVELESVYQNVIDYKFGDYDELLKLRDKLKDASSNVLTKNWFTISRNILRIVEILLKYQSRAYNSIKGWHGYTFEEMSSRCGVDDIQNLPLLKAAFKEMKIFNLWQYLGAESLNLYKKLDPLTLSETMLEQISRETQRYGFLVDLFIYLSKVCNSASDLSISEVLMLKRIFADLNGSNEFDEKLENSLSEQLRLLSEFHPVSNFGVSEKERLEIVKALGSNVTNWYKCPNGHVYGIGNCGGAVVTSKCPECKEDIGGESHRVLANNQAADAEMLEGAGLPVRAYNNPFVVRF